MICILVSPTIGNCQNPRHRKAPQTSLELGFICGHGTRVLDPISKVGSGGNIHRVLSTFMTISVWPLGQTQN